MKNKVLIPFFFGLVLIISLGGWFVKDHPFKKIEQVPLYYQHPMRPEVHSPSPMKDEMGMDYIPIFEEPSSKGESLVPKRSPITISRETQKLLGVGTSLAEDRPLIQKIRTYGTVAFDPTLYNALVEYKEALQAEKEVMESPLPEAKKQTQRLVEASRLKLKLLGISPNQIQNEKGLLINERGRGVWVYAELYEQNALAVHAGIQASITSPSLSSATIRGVVRSIDPTINPTTRTSRARIELQTVNENLRPETLVDVVLEIPLGKRLSIPNSAIFDTGENRYAFVVKNGQDFSPVPIVAGIRTEEFTEIVEGLHQGDVVVNHANFLIDSESRFEWRTP